MTARRRLGIRPWLRGCLLALSLLAPVFRPAFGQEALPVLARVGPWPVASEPIVFRGRVWLANSVKGRNHNSADLYSYDPATGALRYERHLFSQDAGQPLVANGLLYWPFEDSRFSLGWGHFLVGDGQRWRYGTIPGAQIFHTHALAEAGDRIVAATSAWRAGLQGSDDGGVTWRVLYDHPTPDRRVSRIVSLAALERKVFGAVTGRPGRQFLVLAGESVAPVPGWPGSQRLRAATAFDGWLYGLVEAPEGIAVWRSDGTWSEAVAPPRSDWRPRALAADGEHLWATGPGSMGGLLWRSRDGVAWQVHHRLEGGTPTGLTLLGGRPYVTGAGDDGRGILWGPSAAPGPPNADSPEALPPRAPHAPLDWAAERAALEEALSDPASYARHGRALSDRVYRIALADPPADFFADLLGAPMPPDPVSLIGGQVVVPASRFGRWILLWGIAVAGSGRVPPELIAAPWTAPDNPSEKYFETAPAALWAAAAIGQDDRTTIAALVERLGRAADPPWLTGDVVGALTALTGERHAYDLAAWRAWWATAEPSWPK